MDTYTINGFTVEYDTFDLDAMETFDKEVQKIAQSAGEIKNVTADNYIGIVREQCHGILRFFDAVLGEGSADEIFGKKLNAETLLTSYRKFCEDVTQTRTRLRGAVNPANREQRRAAIFKS